jgi:hypothetical protein
MLAGHDDPSQHPQVLRKPLFCPPNINLQCLGLVEAYWSWQLDIIMLFMGPSRRTSAGCQSMSEQLRPCQVSRLGWSGSAQLDLCQHTLRTWLWNAVYLEGLNPQRASKENRQQEQSIVFVMDTTRAFPPSWLDMPFRQCQRGGRVWGHLWRYLNHQPR